MSARTKARKRALDMLFQAEVRKVDPQTIISQEAERAQHEPERMASWIYAREIVDGYIDNATEIDQLIADSAQGWTLERMPTVDLTLLRIASWEIIHNDEVPVPVAVTEAILLAKEYSTEDSGRFINGVLGKIASTVDKEGVV